MTLVIVLVARCYVFNEDGFADIEFFFQLNTALILKSFVEDLVITFFLNRTQSGCIASYMFINFLINFGAVVYGLTNLSTIREENKELA